MQWADDLHCRRVFEEMFERHGDRQENEQTAALHPGGIP